MNFTALLVLLVLMMTASSRPAPHCIDIKPKITHHMHDFRHVSDLGISSVAPWTLKPDVEQCREPQEILNADCKNCTVPGMIAKPIYFRVHVYIRDNNTATLKRCPYELAVGCTCVVSGGHNNNENQT